MDTKYSLFISSGKAICQFKPGRIIASSEINMNTSTYTPSECAALVMTKRPDANGAVWYSGSTSGSCLAEIGGVGRNRTLKDKNRYYLGCLFSSMCLKFIHNIHISRYLVKWYATNHF